MPAFPPFRALRRGVASALAVVGILAGTPLAAQGDLLVAPTRIVISNRGTAEVILSNIGDKEATYRISLELRRMNESGELVPVEKDAADAVELESLDMVRYAPRRVVLPPGQPQSLRISVRPPADLPDGEYRVHMTFNGQPDVTPVTDQAADASQSGFAIKLIPVYAITIPIIIRKGDVETTAAISNPRIEQGAHGPQLKLDMARSGNGSVFGEIRVYRPGESDPVLLVRGIAIYPEINQREFTVPLKPEEAAKLTGHLRFEYREFPEDGGALLASVEGTLG